ncbi:N-acetylglucosamine-1-phosphate uridyltransferase (EC / Glucosamine-1-phosphate N-acetyltransferase (EC [Olavius sp. associated proteobacterium Delta 1]|nr:N-acetylglucosamine-1-phosphate uridyltransferase (EC / Glucosamine-1-phosphate N-acetyltransferase (EC [Olavius sp. associated proteobacterium Delta 1]
MRKNVAVIILAAGMGTRMKSDKAKVLHEIQGRPMILYVVETARKIAGDDVIVVIGNQAQEVRSIISDTAELFFAYQEQQLGTGHAVLCALPKIPEHCDHVIILCGDAPLIQPETIAALLEDHLEARRDVSLLAVEMDNPFGYGRIVLDHNRQIAAIIEEADASADQKLIKLINSGIYCIDKAFLSEALPQIRADNAQGELYLTDIMSIGYQEKRNMGVVVGTNCQQIIGINTCRDLAIVDEIMKSR